MIRVGRLLLVVGLLLGLHACSDERDTMTKKDEVTGADVQQVVQRGNTVPKSKVLDVTVSLEVQPVSMSAKCPVNVRITNLTPDAVLINQRMSIGYQDSDARELFVAVYIRDGDDNIARRTQLYQRDIASADDYIWLAPKESRTTHFDLFEWYELSEPGEYELQVFYQADEPIAPKFDGLLQGIHASGRVGLTVVK